MWISFSTLSHSPQVRWTKKRKQEKKPCLSVRQGFFVTFERTPNLATDSTLQLILDCTGYKELASGGDIVLMWYQSSTYTWILRRPKAMALP